MSIVVSRRCFPAAETLARSVPRNWPSPRAVGELSPVMLLSQSVARASDAASPLRKAWRRTQAPGTELEMCAKLGDAIKRLQGHASDISVELAHSVPLGTARRTLFVDLGQEMDLLEVTIEAIDAPRLPEAAFELMAELLVLILKHALNRTGPQFSRPYLARSLRLLSKATAFEPALRQPLLRHEVLPLLFAELEAAKWPWNCGAGTSGEHSACCATIADYLVEEEFANFMPANAPMVLIELLGTSAEARPRPAPRRSRAPPPLPLTRGRGSFTYRPPAGAARPLTITGGIERGALAQEHGRARAPVRCARPPRRRAQPRTRARRRRPQRAA